MCLYVCLLVCLSECLHVVCWSVCLLSVYSSVAGRGCYGPRVSLADGACISLYFTDCLRVGVCLLVCVAMYSGGQLV